MKIKKIEIETSSGKSVELTLDEAKELYGQLYELFGQKVPATVIVDRWISRPYWEYPWCSTSAGDNTMLFNNNSSTGLKTSFTVDSPSEEFVATHEAVGRLL